MSIYDNERSIVSGQQLLKIPPADVLSREAFIRVPATSGEALPLSTEILSKHVLNLGSIGSGKTNCMFHVVRNLLDRVGVNDRVLIFDAKGDYETEFKCAGDIVIGSDSAVWNIFADLMDCPDAEPDTELLRQLASTLFKKQIDTSNNPTFPSGARDLFIGLTLAFIRREQRAGRASWETLNNATLKRFFTGEVRDPARIAELIEPYPDLQWMRMFILSPQSATTQSYLAPLQAVVNEMFIGCFARAGSFSIRNYVTRGSGRVFISYDAEYGVLMDAMYTALLDLAMRQSIGRTARNGGSIYYILDELPVIPPLTYLDQLLNFGRSLGIKIVAGIQNTSQMIEKYGESRATSILSGFATFFCFHLFDEKSRELMKQRHGKNIQRVSCLRRDGKDSLEVIQEFDVIEDLDITTLKEGRCIVSLPDGEPFLFHPVLYRLRRPPLSVAQESDSIHMPQLRLRTPRG